MEIVKSLQLIMDRDGFCQCFIKHASKDHPQEIVAVVDVGRWFHKQVETRYMYIYIINSITRIQRTKYIVF